MDFASQLKKLEWVLNGFLPGRGEHVLAWNLVQGKNVIDIEIKIDKKDILLTMSTRVFETQVIKCIVFYIPVEDWTDTYDWVNICMNRVTNEFACKECHAAKIFSHNLCSNCMVIEHNAFETSDNCAVCLEKNTTRSSKLVCGHNFHQACVSAILKRQKNAVIRCPLCRSDQIAGYTDQGYTFTHTSNSLKHDLSDEESSDSDEEVDGPVQYEVQYESPTQLSRRSHVRPQQAREPIEPESPTQLGSRRSHVLVPDSDIDHIDDDPFQNRISQLIFET